VELVIRRATRADKRGVREAVRTIWGGGDRVPALFDRWVSGRTGPFFVAETNGRIAGMGKLTVISSREAWLEGGRVAPRYRRRGISTALIAHRLAYARDHGFAVARFSTASDNTAIHRAARRFGFRRVRALARYEARASRDVVPPRLARPRDARRVRALVGPFVQEAASWEWRELTDRDVRDAIRRGRAFLTRDRRAAAIVAPARERELPVVAFGGSGEASAELLSGLRAEAARRRATEVEIYLSGTPQARAATRAGYTRTWPVKALLYELDLARGV
jgi:ribosomal protein S18 acetylase RimI-like enzyme